MAGITTSETLAGEQPKDDDLGSRVDELESASRLQLGVITGLERILKDFLRRIEALEKTNDGRKTKNNRK